MPVPNTKATTEMVAIQMACEVIQVVPVKGWETEVDWSETVAKYARRSLVGFQSTGLPCIFQHT